jgi:Bifunctional DNA primase/polymerase, N-terminal
VGTVADSRNLRAALGYARAGWRVFPAIAGEKAPATRHGVKDATSDPAQIRTWWQRNPDQNVAIACGYPGPDVLDIDRHVQESGFPALRRLRAAGLIANPQTMIRTPSDGAHLYFAPTPGSGNGSITAACIDHRGEGGYVIAPPSEVRRAADGQLRPYVVVRHQASAERISWAAIRAFLDPQPQRQWQPPAHPREGGRQNLDHLVDHMAGLDDGRKRYLYWAANRILDHNQPERLADLAAAARQAGSDPRVIERTIRSAQATPRQDPHARAYPRGAARLSQTTPRAEPAAGHVPQRQPQRTHTAVLEVGPADEPQEAASASPAPGPGRQACAQRETAQEPGSAPSGPEDQPPRAQQHEPSSGEAARPIARPGIERPEPEAGE